MLSPFEIEDVEAWLRTDGITADYINLAVREASLANKLSFRYLTGILRAWWREGARTVEQVEARLKRHEDLKRGVSDDLGLTADELIEFNRMLIGMAEVWCDDEEDKAHQKALYEENIARLLT